jgi:signal peptidase II
LGIAALTLIADRVTKTVIANQLMPHQTWHPPVSFLRPVVSLTYTTNTGAAFGLFPDQGVFFIVIAVLVITAILFYYRHLPSGYAVARVALGLQLGGALGNLSDRLRQGYVVDFVDLNFWPLHNWPVFNLADSAIVVGVGLLALTMLRDTEEPDDEVGASEGDATYGNRAQMSKPRPSGALRDAEEPRTADGHG